jgi:threonine aldolase
VFVYMAPAAAAALREAGARFYEWSMAGLDAADGPRGGEVLYRLVASFRTTEAEVDQFVGLLR